MADSNFTFFRGALASLALSLAALAPPMARAADELPKMHADAGRTSVSGLSSGAFMAVQYGVAFSSGLVGLGVVAGGPYNCSYANLAFVYPAITTCMSGLPSGDLSWSAAQGFAAMNQIDAVAGIARLKVYVFTGKQDSVVKPSVVAATRDFFAAAGVAKKNLLYVDKLPAGHAFIAPAFGNDCGTNAAPYIDHCAVQAAGQTAPYDQPREILQHIYGPLQPAAPTLSATVQPFNQRSFANAATSMDATGYVYIPKACAGTGSGCAVHVVFHGCLQGAQTVKDDVYAQVGYNRWADTNKLIVLYPQVVTSAANPQGCWDWWGYTSPVFQTRSGVQMSAVKAMVDALTMAK